MSNEIKENGISSAWEEEIKAEPGKRETFPEEIVDEKMERSRKMAEKLRKNFRAFWLSFLLLPIFCCCFVPLSFLSSFLPGISKITVTLLSFLVLPLILLGGAVIPAVLLCRLYYRYWKLIPAHLVPGMTPAKALGYLFIPYFNCYWSFRSLWGLGKAMEKLLAGEGAEGKRTSLSRIPFAFSILQVIFLILGMFLWAVAYVSRMDVNKFLMQIKSPGWFLLFNSLVHGLTIAMLVLTVVMLLKFQSGALRILADPSINWQDNPKTSKAPILWGILWWLVITILISTFSIPASLRSIAETVERQREIRCNKNMSVLASGIAFYREDNGCLPDTLKIYSIPKDTPGFCDKKKPSTAYLYTPKPIPGKGQKLPLIVCPLHDMNTVYWLEKNGGFEILAPAKIQK